MIIGAPEPITLSQSVNRWAELALELGWVDQWVEGAIFPCEMVYFMGRIETAHISTIIESGRQDGYSTLLLGEFARRTGVQIISVDYEEDRERGERCRERLASYPITMLVGDAFRLVGDVLEKDRDRPTAILVDGPKGWSANALVLACAPYPNIRLIGLHNQYLDAAETRALMDLFQEKAFYEDFPLETDGAWQQLRQQEHAYLTKNAVRSLVRSSLAAFSVSDELRNRLGKTTRKEFMLFQPPLINFFWRLGWYGVAPFLHRASFRIANSRLLYPLVRK